MLLRYAVGRKHQPLLEGWSDSGVYEHLLLSVYGSPDPHCHATDHILLRLGVWHCTISSNNAS